MNTYRTRTVILTFSLFLITACGGAGTPTPAPLENGAPATVSQTETPPPAELTYCPTNSAISQEITNHCATTTAGIHSGQFQSCVCRWKWVFNNYTCNEILKDPASLETSARWRSGC